MLKAARSLPGQLVFNKYFFKYCELRCGKATMKTRKIISLQPQFYHLSGLVIRLNHQLIEERFPGII